MRSDIVMSCYVYLEERILFGDLIGSIEKPYIYTYHLFVSSFNFATSQLSQKWDIDDPGAADD